MSFSIYTTGIKFSENKVLNIGIEAQYKLFVSENIKVVIDTRSICGYNKYEEKHHYNPSNLHRNLKEKQIDYYNVGDLVRYLTYSLKNPGKRSALEIKTKFYANLSEFIDQLGTRYGNVCILFQTCYCLANNRKALTGRGSYSKHMRNISQDSNIIHYLPFKEGRKTFSNYELWNDAYGELTTIKTDIERKKRLKEIKDRFTDEDDYHSHDEDSSFGYSSQDLDDMYRDAFDGNPEAQWNID